MSNPCRVLSPRSFTSVTLAPVMVARLLVTTKPSSVSSTLPMLVTLHSKSVRLLVLRLKEMSRVAKLALLLVRSRTLTALMLLLLVLLALTAISHRMAMTFLTCFLPLPLVIQSTVLVPLLVRWVGRSLLGLTQERSWATAFLVVSV